ncbi:hypothetical protein J2850_001298 [Azospirillum picis]|uniref:DUF2934 domain-containing protein n=1 Tax=Azospirillum picis TaxID=488438 RepID=A0ABU0MGH0_9PROT|nr:hypothetical protein [Azospirillum picis]MDQ0532336.1 hypothetical protein [Azospirillum picis]
MDNEQRIRERAYAIWLDEGCPHGRDSEHWLRAEQALADDAAGLPDLSPVVAEVKAPRKAAAPKTVAPKAAGPSKSVKAEEPAVAAAEPPKARKPRVRKTVTA